MDKFKTFLAKCYWKITDWYFKIPNWGRIAISCVLFLAMFLSLIGFAALAGA